MKTGYRVCDAMTRKPIAVTPETSILDCANLMKSKKVGSLVVKEGDILKGYLTEQGIVHKVVASKLDPSKTPVSKIMATTVATIEPNADIYEAITKMRDLDTRQLPVVDNGKLVGLLTQKDILKIQPQLFELLVEKFELREQELKPIFQANSQSLEGTCDMCGEYFNDLREIEGDFLCEKCRKVRK